MLKTNNFICLSAELDYLSLHENSTRTRDLYRMLTDAGIPFHRCEGVYNGKSELSVMIHSRHLDTAKLIASVWCQESILECDGVNLYLHHLDDDRCECIGKLYIHPDNSVVDFDHTHVTDLELCFSAI